PLVRLDVGKPFARADDLAALADLTGRLVQSDGNVTYKQTRPDWGPGGGQDDHRHGRARANRELDHGIARALPAMAERDQRLACAPGGRGLPHVRAQTTQARGCLRPNRSVRRRPLRLPPRPEAGFSPAVAFCAPGL